MIYIAFNMDAKEALELKATLTRQYESDMEHIDGILSIYARLNGSVAAPVQPESVTPVVAAPVAPSTTSDDIDDDISDDTGGSNAPVGQSTGLRALVRAHRDELPNEYTKADVRRLLELNGYKDRIVENSLLGTMRVLVKEGFAKIKRKSSGRKAARYEKIVKTPKIV